MHSENNDAGAIDMVGQTQMEFDTPALYSSETQNTRTLEEIQRTFKWMMWLLIVAVFVIVAPTIMTRSLPHHHPKSRIPDNYTTALHKNNYGIRWRRDSGIQDGNVMDGGLVGGYHDTGDDAKYYFPLDCWSVIEYEGVYKTVQEYDHTRELIKWGVRVPDDHTCWTRLEDMDYPCLQRRPFVFRDNKMYSEKLVKAAIKVFEFALDKSKGTTDSMTLLTRLCIFLDPGYPYEAMLINYHEITGRIMCSYLQHYLNVTGVKGWYCVPDFILAGDLYVVRYANKYPNYLHHHGASVDESGFIIIMNPNTIIGTMVGSLDKFDEYKNAYSYPSHTEPTITRNVELIIALVSLITSGDLCDQGIEKNIIFFTVPPPLSP
ncbi:hypothetical protein DCAR_0310660 [Daucus carota subsp. sativus]|uniref:cellulase n=1 Tax=Daucus carota subsp. sativus TaxID=79200 RepID=A0AAF1AT35_DAUCS|nr:hypothetical protein DCAR_0310660 [Daucus carota subsp. sativus]